MSQSITIRMQWVTAGAALIAAWAGQGMGNAYAAQITLNALDSGVYRSYQEASVAGFVESYSHTPSEENYPLSLIVDPGSDVGVGGYAIETRDFFFFDLSSVSGTIMTAELHLTHGTMQAGSADVTFFDVVTPAATVRAGGSGGSSSTQHAVYQDLGQGNPYANLTLEYAVPTDLGPITLSDTYIHEIPLNGNALNDITSALGGLFGIGGMASNFTGCDVGNLQDCYVFSADVGSAVRQLVLTTATDQIPGGPPLPVPASFGLLGAGLAGLAAVRRRRKAT